MTTHNATDRSAAGSRVSDSVILTLVGSYLPGYKAGGPIRSIENLSGALGGEFHFRIVTRDRDLGDHLPFPGIVANRWVRVGKADVVYVASGLRGFARMWTLLRSVDQSTVLYLNSFFARRFSMLPVLMYWFALCRPQRLVLAPRGEFSPGALRFKRMRKLLYIRIARWLGVYEDIVWHASTDFEAEDIRKHYSVASAVSVAGVITDLAGNRKGQTGVVVTALDIADPGSLGSRARSVKKPGQLRAVFISRFSRKKNLSGALKMLEDVAGNVSFDLYGPVEDPAYWEECQRLIAALPPNIRVRYCGEIKHEEVEGVFAKHDLLLFPTFGENYGHVIAEALKSGCPVLISDQTPWRNLEAEGIGWDLPLSQTERYRSVLQQCVDGDGEWFATLSARAADFAAKRASDPATINANRKLFQLAFVGRSHVHPS